MRKIAHVINPVVVNELSDLYVAQPITFSTMKTARDIACRTVEVMLVSAQYPEDIPLVPIEFQLTPDLDRSVLDICTFSKKRKLPLIKDILNRVYETSDAEYIIYTNIDIGLMPHFYLAVNNILESGYDAFVINRRTISDKYNKVEEIPLMYSEIGKPHPGWDCFVFKKDLYPKFRLGDICIGASYIGFIMILNIVYNTARFKVLENEHLTFHIGEEQAWLNEDNLAFTAHNQKEALKVLMDIKNEVGTFDNTTPLGSFLLTLRNRKDFAFLKDVLICENDSPVKKDKSVKRALQRLLLKR